VLPPPPSLRTPLLCTVDCIPNRSIPIILKLTPSWLCLQRQLMDAAKLSKKDLQKLSASIGRLTVSAGRTALTDPKLLEGVVTCLKKVSDAFVVARFGSKLYRLSSCTLPRQSSFFSTVQTMEVRVAPHLSKPHTA